MGRVGKTEPALQCLLERRLHQCEICQIYRRALSSRAVGGNNSHRNSAAERARNSRRSQSRVMRHLGRSPARNFQMVGLLWRRRQRRNAPLWREGRNLSRVRRLLPFAILVQSNPLDLYLGQRSYLVELPHWFQNRQGDGHLRMGAERIQCPLFRAACAPEREHRADRRTIGRSAHFRRHHPIVPLTFSASRHLMDEI